MVERLEGVSIGDMVRIDLNGVTARGNIGGYVTEIGNRHVRLSTLDPLTPDATIFSNRLFTSPSTKYSIKCINSYQILRKAGE